MTLGVTVEPPEDLPPQHLVGPGRPAARANSATAVRWKPIRSTSLAAGITVSSRPACSRPIVSITSRCIRLRPSTIEKNARISGRTRPAPGRHARAAGRSASTGPPGSRAPAGCRLPRRHSRRQATRSAGSRGKCSRSRRPAAPAPTRACGPASLVEGQVHPPVGEVRRQQVQPIGRSRGSARPPRSGP